VKAVRIVKNNLKFSPLELELKEYAKENKVPIIFDEGLSFVEAIIGAKRPKNILEIGTAIGYSAIRMASVCNSNIYTIERDNSMYNLAIENIKKAGLENNIHVIFKDALEAFSDVSNIKFDLIFIDAAKAQYHKFFDIYTPLLNDNGVVICDNMLFHGLVNDINNIDSYSRSVRGLIRKLNLFHDELLNNDKFQTAIYDIGDGMSVSIKK
jgi:predicted O-methyltransferase YrrM